MFDQHPLDWAEHSAIWSISGTSLAAGHILTPLCQETRSFPSHCLDYPSQVCLGSGCQVFEKVLAARESALPQAKLQLMAPAIFGSLRCKKCPSRNDKKNKKQSFKVRSISYLRSTADVNRPLLLVTQLSSALCSQAKANTKAHWPAALVWICTLEQTVIHC